MDQITKRVFEVMASLDALAHSQIVANSGLDGEQVVAAYHQLERLGYLTVTIGGRPGNRTAGLWWTNDGEVVARERRRSAAAEERTAE